jgi:hypothetical protein
MSWGRRAPPLHPDDVFFYLSFLNLLVDRLEWAFVLLNVATTCCFSKVQDLAYFPPSVAFLSPGMMLQFNIKCRHPPLEEPFYSIDNKLTRSSCNIRAVVHVLPGIRLFF